MASHNHAVTRTLISTVLARLVVARVGRGEAGVLGHLRNHERVEIASAHYAIGISGRDAGGSGARPGQGHSKGGNSDKAKHAVRCWQSNHTLFTARGRVCAVTIGKGQSIACSGAM